MVEGITKSRNTARGLIAKCAFLVKNSLPLVTSSIGLMLMSLIDTLFISRLGPNALSAQALASVINMTFFMGLVAFIFPIANLAHLNPQKAKHYLKAGLLIVWIVAACITIFFWFLSGYIEQELLPVAARNLFHEYFVWSSLRILPSATFIYLRMLIYTLDKPIPITSYMAFALIATLILDFVIYCSFNNPLLIMFAIAIGAVFIFLMLCYLVNKKIPENSRIFAILFNIKIYKREILEVCKSSVPAMFTSFFEFLFFCVIGIIVTKFAYEQLSFYRIVVQIEELCVLFFYSLTVIISMEFSKNLNDKKDLLNNSVIFSCMVILASMLLYLTYPAIISSYNLRILPNENLLGLVAAVLLIAECLMLLSLSYLRSIAKNNQIFFIVTCVNWFASIPIALLLHLNNVYEFIGLIIFSNLLTTILAFLSFKFYLSYNNIRHLPG
jgi:Na+-driven multidrug efflux pump